MKKCDYCGRENPDEATACAECGSTKFKQTPSSDTPERQKHLFLRLLVALGVWVVVSGISLYVAWHQGNHSGGRYRLWLTQKALASMDKAIVAYHAKFGLEPTNFDQLASMSNALPEFEEWSWNGFTDAWNHPFVLSTEGTNCVVVSYGRDGKPGGIGVDYDLSTKNPYAKESSPTFSQFLDDKEMQGMINSSFVCGGLAASLSFLTVRIPSLDKRGIILLSLSLAATLIGAIWTTIVITALHVPNGH